MGGSNAGPPMDDSYARMKKSVERISRVLGLTNAPAGDNKENDDGPSTGNFNGRDSLPARNSGVPDMIFRDGNAPIDLTNQNQGNDNDGDQRQESPYHHLRQKSPQRMTQEELDPPTATKFASVSVDSFNFAC